MEEGTELGATADPPASLDHATGENQRTIEREQRRRRKWLVALIGSIVGAPVVGVIAVWVVLAMTLGSLSGGCEPLFAPPPCAASEDRLVKAATAGDFAVVRDLLDAGDPVDGSDPTARPLECAIDHLHTDIALELLDRGARASNPEDLWTAAQSGQVIVTRSLLDHGATASDDVLRALVGDEMGCSPLGDFSLGWSSPANQRDASDGESALIAGLLIDHGADPANGGLGPTPLLWATYYEKATMVGVLLDHGAPADWGGPVDRLFLQGAAAEAQGAACTDALAYPSTGYEAMRTSSTVEGSSPLPTTAAGTALLPLFPVEYSPIGGVDNVTPLTAAALKGNLDLATLLLDHGADPNAVSGGLVSPLYCAAVRGDDAMVLLLMSRGARALPPADPRVMSPSEVANRAGHPGTAQLIYELGAGR